MKLKKLVNMLKASGLVLLAFSFYSNGYSQQIQPLEVLNSPYDEQHPVFSAYGEIFYTIGFHPENTGGSMDFGDIWMSKKNENGVWTKPLRISDLSTAGNDVVVGFTDALTLLVYHEGNGKKQGIHQYSRFGNSWNYLRPVEMGNFKNNAKHFSGRLNPEGNVMILSMNSFGSYGNEDIYVSIKNAEAKWSSPINLGPQINTFAQELTPYLSENLKTLYFSSNKTDSNRGRDIYYSHRIGDGWENWTTPQTIQYANTIGSELSYLPMGEDKKLAIFTSTQNSEGFGDLMVVNFEKFEAPKEEVLIAEEKAEQPLSIPEDTVTEKEMIAKRDTVLQQKVSEKLPTKELVEEKAEEEIPIAPPVEDTVQEAALFADVEVLDYHTRENLDYKIMVSNSRGLKMAVHDQRELFSHLEEPQWSSVLISAKGYLPQNLEVSAWKTLIETDQPLLMMPAKAGTSIVLDNIQFNRGTSDFADAKSIQILDNLADFLKDNPEIKIRLEGHTDNAGDPVLNKELSLNRASKIRGYLTLNGVDFERIRISGWGGTRPIAPNDTEEGRNLNRRVAMQIVQ